MDKNKEIKKSVEHVCESLDMELHHIKPQKNKIVSFRVKSNKSVRPDSELYKSISELDCTNSISQKHFTMGKKADNCCWYQISISLTDDYFDGTVDTKTTLGKILNFFINNNIETPKDFLESTLNVLNDMQLFTRTVKDRKSKKTIWRVKYHYIKFLYKNNLIDEIVRQISYCGDDLIRFTINGEHHWLRTEQADFISCVSKIEIIDEIYSRHHKRDALIEVVTEEKDLEISKFDLFIDMFRQLNNDSLLKTVGMKGFEQSSY